jgi:hypothetical protein
MADATPQDQKPTTDYGRAFVALQAKQKPLAALWSYYDGDQPLAYSTKRLKDIFQDLNTHFSENWCAVVVDSLKDRVNLAGLRSEDAAVQTALDELWAQGDLNLTSDDVHEAALVTGEGYLLAWPGDDGLPAPYANDPRLCHVYYSPDNPRRPLWAAKGWVAEDERYYLTLYYPDRLEYYSSTKPADQVQSWKSLEPLQEPAQNPYGVIPVYHFRASRRGARSELLNVLPLQDAINKLLADMMVAAEFGAFAQRYVISQMETGKVEQFLKNSAYSHWILPAGDGEGEPTQVGQFAPTDLANYLSAIDNLAEAIATISRTPRHYFMGDAGANVSGEALIALEAPLNKKAQDRIDAYTPTWQQSVAFMLKIRGMTVDPASILPVFDKPETIQPRTAAEITQIRVTSGMPLKSALRLEGMEEAEIEQIAAEAQEEEAARQATLGQALMDAQERFDGGNQNPDA